MIHYALRELFASIGLAAVLVEVVVHHFSGKWLI
jgi:hypothetical protein